MLESTSAIFFELSFRLQSIALWEFVQLASEIICDADGSHLLPLTEN